MSEEISSYQGPRLIQISGNKIKGLTTVRLFCFFVLGFFLDINYAYQILIE